MRFSPHICCVPCLVPVNLRGFTSRSCCFLWDEYTTFCFFTRTLCLLLYSSWKKMGFDVIPAICQILERKGLWTASGMLQQSDHYGFLLSKDTPTSKHPYVHNDSTPLADIIKVIHRQQAWENMQEQRLL